MEERQRGEEKEKAGCVNRVREDQGLGWSDEDVSAVFLCTPGSLFFVWLDHRSSRRNAGEGGRHADSRWKRSHS